MSVGVIICVALGRSKTPPKTKNGKQKSGKDGGKKKKEKNLFIKKERTRKR